MKILITGHQGFIGSALYEYLSNQKYDLIGLDIKSGKNILSCDLPDCDLVIHLAGIGGVRESLNDPKKYWENNVEATKRILNFYKNKRVLVAGSSSQYEPHLNPYAASKKIIESIEHSNVVFMRLHTVYSSKPRKGMFFEKLISGNLSYVTNHYRDFIHIDDVCRAIQILIHASFVGSLDIGTGKSIQISSILPNLPVKTFTPNERQHTCADIDILKSLGFVVNFDVLHFMKIYADKYFYEKNSFSNRRI